MRVLRRQEMIAFCVLFQLPDSCVLHTHTPDCINCQTAVFYTHTHRTASTARQLCSTHTHTGLHYPAENSAAQSCIQLPDSCVLHIHTPDCITECSTHTHTGLHQLPDSCVLHIHTPDCITELKTQLPSHAFFNSIIPQTNVTFTSVTWTISHTIKH